MITGHWRNWQGYTALSLSAVHLHHTILISSIIIPYWSPSLQTASFSTFIYSKCTITNTKPWTVYHKQKHKHCTMPSHIYTSRHDLFKTFPEKFDSLNSTESDKNYFFQSYKQGSYKGYRPFSFLQVNTNREAKVVWSAAVDKPKNMEHVIITLDFYDLSDEQSTWVVSYMKFDNMCYYSFY